MAFGGSTNKMSDETFDYICTSCAEENLIKEAINYCVVCQRYCCHECVTAHKRIPILKGHTLLDNSSGQSPGQRSSLPAFPTEQCSIHKGKILDMYCGNHDVVGCYICVAKDHMSCSEDVSSVTDNIDKLFKKSDTAKTKRDIAGMLDLMKDRLNITQCLLQQLRASKTCAVQAIKAYRSEIDKYLDNLEYASIKDLERKYRKMESELLEERKTYDKFIDEFNKLDDLITQTEENTAQLFVSTKLAQRKIISTEDEEKETRKTSVVMYFSPVAELIQLVQELKSLGKSSVNTTSPKYDLYEATLINTIDIKLTNDTKECSILGSCIVDDTVLFTDNSNQKMKRVDITTLSVVDSCELSDRPYGVCSVGAQKVAVACDTMVQFVYIHEELSLLRQLKMKHKCYGIAYKNHNMYVTDDCTSLYMYDMSGNLLKTITSDTFGQPVFNRSEHIVFRECGSRLFVGDKVGLVCFDANCDHVITVKHSAAKADGVCVDGRGNVIVANIWSNCIAQIRQDGKKRGVIVSSTDCLSSPRSVCFHQELNILIVTNFGNVVQLYQLC